MESSSFLVCQFYFLVKTPWKWPKLSSALSVSLAGRMIVYLLFTPYLSKKTNPLELAVLTFFEKNEKLLKGQKVETSHPYFALLLDENYFKPHSTVHLMTSELLEHHQPRTFILWDSHFGPLESHINLESLIKNPKYQLISAEKSLGNTVCLFQAK